MKPSFLLQLPIWAFAITSLSTIQPLQAEKDSDKDTKDQKVETNASSDVDPVSKESSVTIDGKKITYEVTAGKLTLKDDKGKPKASIFHTTYIRTGISDDQKRPVMFAFNGGPGSSSVWLHIGLLGPRILDLPGDGTAAPKPPVRIKDNSLSLLDACDLVFIDPVSTGYSRIEKDGKADAFHGLNGDIESVGDFIRRWITDHDRWASPKYLLGESYGGIRAAGLSQHLQSRYGMSLNGVVLLSALLDFRTIQPSQGNDLTYSIFLPAYTSTALHHGKITGDGAELTEQSTAFAFGAYAQALLQGNQISAEKTNEIASQLAAYTGIDQETWIKNDLRLHPSNFRAELLRKEGKVLGRFDSRVAWDATDETSTYSTYDPSYALAYGAFSTAMMDYLGREIGYKEDRPYEILTGKVHPWNWNSNNRYVNVTDRLETAMRDNPELKVLVMSGHADLATPPQSVAYSVRHMLEAPKSSLGNIDTVFYQGGHMFYMNPPDLKKARADLLEFIGK